MLNLWAFLLQTLTASGAALILLVIKRLFRDKLPPKWQFAVWGILALVLLYPAATGRYTLINWQIPVEVMKGFFRDYSFTRVYFPFPVLTAIPRTLPQWLFVGYLLGVLWTAAGYVLSYCKLRRILRRSAAPDDQTMAAIAQVAETYDLKTCRTVMVEGLPSAFLWRIFRPVLVLPAKAAPDEKILLHELLHLKNRDTLWSLLVCLFRCIHWCNPFLIYCADLCLNDLEARCDQMVLERLEGDDRRDYGRTLLAMANDGFPKVPASTGMHNGAKQIRHRVEAISRFKQYPAGMGLVSVCVLLILAAYLITGVQTSTIHNDNSIHSKIRFSFATASARSIPCTTAAAAFDTYAMAVLDQNGLYRILCASASDQSEIHDAIAERAFQNMTPYWNFGLNSWPDKNSGYGIYNIRQTDDGGYEGLFVCKLNYPPDGKPLEEGKMCLALQKLRAVEEQGRWVIIPLEDMYFSIATDQPLRQDNNELPAVHYYGMQDLLQAEAILQTVHWVNRVSQTGHYDTTVRPNTDFTHNYCHSDLQFTHLGTQEQRDAITRLGMSATPVYPGVEPDDLPSADGAYISGGNSTGTEWGGVDLQAGWGPSVLVAGGGTGVGDEYNGILIKGLAQYYLADLYVNRELIGTLTLYPQEGGSQ